VQEGVLMPVNVNEIEPDEKIVEIEMERLREFRNHPFKVQADAQMLQLIESISKYGVMNPLIVRPLPEGVYEIIFFFKHFPDIFIFLCSFLRLKEQDI
jgi:hypothetical protein